ncbi:recombination mediator RecR [Maricaulis sp.]|jgi:recombination protein RecR|uniref:recombination mediator RecR n=1 Tax=Maricaulis sp. TaxID=1486257 RepID=UPI0026006780|nr:recombination mediator RecR [Maricaulis sp.]MDF1770000.1 recombination mediator RecR [Maricaulis sp.]
MKSASAGPEIERLITLLAKLPGLGPRSARRAALHLLGKKDALMRPLADALADAADKIRACAECGNLDVADPCTVCAAPNRLENAICVVETVGDLWALERAGAFKGRYHVLGGVLSALDGVRPEDLNIAKLVERAAREEVSEIVLALNATVDGQTTAHYLADRMTDCSVSITSLARGVPVGGELDYLDDGTLAAAFRSRSSV